MVEINIYLNKIPLDCTKNICHALVTTHNEKKNQDQSVTRGNDLGRTP